MSLSLGEGYLYLFAKNIVQVDVIDDLLEVVILPIPGIKNNPCALTNRAKFNLARYGISLLQPLFFGLHHSLWTALRG